MLKPETIDGAAPYSIHPYDMPGLGKNDDVAAVLEERGNQWGDAIGTHCRIAQVWSGILDCEVSALQVALCMEGLKLVRAEINPDDPDSFHDAQGYDRIAELIAGHRSSL